MVALEHFLAVKHKLETIEQAKEMLFIVFGSCMPIAAILFQLLIDETEVPRSINDWIIACFNSGRIEVGNIKNQADGIFGNFSERFYSCWENQDICKT